MYSLGHKIAIIAITGDTYEIRSFGILKKLNWKNLEERRNKGHKLSYVSKALTSQCPEKNSSMFEISKSDRYNLRSNNKMLMLSKPKTDSMKRTFEYTAAKVWIGITTKTVIILIDFGRCAYCTYFCIK